MTEQISPDGHWRWDGTRWVPNQPATTPTGGSTPWPSGPGAGYGYPGAQPGGYPAYPAYAPQPSVHDGKAIASLVLALLGVCGLGSVAAVVLGHLSRKEARAQGRQPSGVALAGLIIGYIGLVAALLFGLMFAIGAGIHGSFHSTTTCYSTPTSSGCS